MKLSRLSAGNNLRLGQGRLVLYGMKAPNITQIEMEESEIALCEKAAKRLGFTQTAYTSSSQIWGLYCLPDRATQKHGVFMKTAELGLLFVADLEDLQLHDLAEEHREMRKARV